MLSVLAYGGGVQSTALLVLIIEGKMARPDLILMSDTGSEMPETLAVMERAAEECLKADIPFEIVKSKKGALHEAYKARSRLPIASSRLCTATWKREPMDHAIKRHLGASPSDRLPAGSAIVWFGITTDERGRATGSPRKWIGARYPLLEMDLSRDDCAAILEGYGWGGVVKSGCFLCPFKRKRDWLELRINHPALFKEAKDMERAKLDDIGGVGFLAVGTLDRLDFDATLDQWTPGDPVAEHRTCKGGPDGAGGCFL